MSKISNLTRSPVHPFTTPIHPNPSPYPYAIEFHPLSKHAHKSSISLFLPPIHPTLPTNNLRPNTHSNTHSPIHPTQNHKSTLPSPLHLFPLIYSKLLYLPFLPSLSKHIQCTHPLTYLHLNNHALNAFLTLFCFYTDAFQFCKSIIDFNIYFIFFHNLCHSIPLILLYATTAISLELETCDAKR